MGWTQNPPTFGSWGFDSPSRHHRYGFFGEAAGVQNMFATPDVLENLQL